MSSTTWVGAYLVLCRLLQMVLELTNQQFLLLFACGAALIFIVTSLTHTHDIDAEEIALKTADKLEKSLEEITGTGEENMHEKHTPEQSEQGPSGHKAPDAF